MLEMTNENFARLLRGLTIAVGNRRNRILLYQFLAAEIRALHCSYGVGDGVTLLQTAAISPSSSGVGAIGKESGAAGRSYAGGVGILHGADHFRLMEFQQQKVSSRCRGRDRSIERVRAKGPHGER